MLRLPCEPVSEPSSTPSNRDLLLAYALPYAAYVLLGALDAQLGRSGVYVARLVVVPALLAWQWRSYSGITGPGRPWVSCAWGAAAGLAATPLWIGLALPLARAAGIPAEPWSEGEWWLRLLGSTALPPIFEELLFRGWILGAIVAWTRLGSAGRALDEASLHDLEPGAWTTWAVTGSTLLFALGHQGFEWPAALAYGALMCALWITRRDLLSCMVAHATTNLCLALWIRAEDLWVLW